MTEVSSRSVCRAVRILLFLAVCSNHGLSAEDSKTTVKSKTQDGTSKPMEDAPRRDRSHIDSTLGLNSASMLKTKAQLQHNAESIKQLTDIYKSAVRPMEELYNFHSLNKHIMTEAEIKAKPMVLFVGPWSTGKSTMINYLAGITDPLHTLRTGAEPTTSDFTVLMHGDTYRTVEGLVLATDSSKGFAALEKFGQGFLEKLQGVEMPYELLRQVTFVDTPGIIENRKQQERGYPFNEVMKWFIERSDLIFVVFDPTKLDVGIELETLFKQLKGREAQIRIILNKADSIAMQELMRVYGALFWSLQPLINVTEPPRVYTGSFWNNPFKLDSIHDLFLKEEVSLLQDLREVISNQLENKVAFVRQHAILVRIHALLVNRYLEVFNTHKSSFGGNEALLADIVENPQNHHVFQSILVEPFVSKYDLPSVDTYKEFFSVSALNTFKGLSSHCTLLGGCSMDHLVAAIAKELPRLLKAIKPSLGACDAESCQTDKNSNP